MLRLTGQNNRQGSVLFISISICLILMIWAVAATVQVNRQTNFNLLSANKTQAYYLAKQGASRSLYLLNNANFVDPDSQQKWAQTHQSRETADRKTTPGVACWLETTASTQIIRSEATWEGFTHVLSVPIAHQGPSPVKLYSIAPTAATGQTAIVWTSSANSNWDALPPIPGFSTVNSVAATESGDVYALATSGTTTALWRYRQGQGWIQMPDLPNGAAATQLTACMDSQLVCKGSDKEVHVLSLGTEKDVPMEWKSISVPSNRSLDKVAAHSGDSRYLFATLTNDNGATEIQLCDTKDKSWSKFTSPSLPSNLIASGGLTADQKGTVYVGHNPKNASGQSQPSEIYGCKRSSPTDTSSTWAKLPAIPAIEWTLGQARNRTGGLATDISDLKADNQGTLWLKRDIPGTGNHTVITMDGLK
jgi:hypothetical protein